MHARTHTHSHAHVMTRVKKKCHDVQGGEVTSPTEGTQELHRHILARKQRRGGSLRVTRDGRRQRAVIAKYVPRICGRRHLLLGSWASPSPPLLGSRPVSVLHLLLLTQRNVSQSRQAAREVLLHRHTFASLPLVLLGAGPPGLLRFFLLTTMPFSHSILLSRL